MDNEERISLEVERRLRKAYSVLGIALVSLIAFGGSLVGTGIIARDLKKTSNTTMASMTHWVRRTVCKFFRKLPGVSVSRGSPESL